MHGSRFTDELRVRLYGEYCVYCGMSANSDEHFPPATYSRTGVIIPACCECNVLAGTLWISDFYERVFHVKQRLAQRYKSVLITPNWSIEEINELDYSLQKIVQPWQKLKNMINSRLSWDAVLYLETIDSDENYSKASSEMNLIIIKEKQNLREIKTTQPLKTQTRQVNLTLKNTSPKVKRVKQLKPRICRHCGSEFIPFYSGQYQHPPGAFCLPPGYQ